MTRWARIAICTDCWLHSPESRGGTRPPARLNGGALSFGELLDKCGECGRVTSSGIYVRREVQG